MKVECLLGILISFMGVWVLSSCHEDHRTGYRENGWYHVLRGQTDSISQEPIVTVKDFVALRLDTDCFGKYAISGQISKHKLNKWADETEKSIGKRIAFLWNDSVITCPNVNTRIEGGAFQITSSRSNDKLLVIYEQLKKEKIDSIEVLFKGWDKDSTFVQLSQEQKDSLRMSIDYWDAKAWIDLTTNPAEHVWYSIRDSTEYKNLEKALREELDRPHFSSNAFDYMKSEAYNTYKKYICDNPEYINLMFQGFLFKDIRGLHGFLIDDIIQTKYPSAPSIRFYTSKAENADDEILAIYEWQKKIWFLMNIP